MKFLTFKPKALVKIHLFYNNRPAVIKLYAQTSGIKQKWHVTGAYISKIMAVRLTKHRDMGVNTN